MNSVEIIALNYKLMEGSLPLEVVIYCITISALLLEFICYAHTFNETCPSF